jgi:hypothetical protein
LKKKFSRARSSISKKKKTIKSGGLINGQHDFSFSPNFIQFCRSGYKKLTARSAFEKYMNGAMALLGAFGSFFFFGFFFWEPSSGTLFCFFFGGGFDVLLLASFLEDF